MIEIEVNIPCIIIPARTGVRYCNQTGGYAVHYLAVEGYIIPLEPNYYTKVRKGIVSNNPANPYWDKFSLQEHFDKLFAPLPCGTKYNGHGYRGIDKKDAEYIESAFKGDFFLKIRVDRKRLKECEEARVFVNITLKHYDESGEIKLLKASGVLTWKNSD